MPCYEPEPTQRERREQEKRYNHKEYGFHITDKELISELGNVCCEMGNLIDKLDKNNEEIIWPMLSERTRDWYFRHKKRDEEKRQKYINELSKKFDKLSQELNSIKDEAFKYGLILREEID